MFTCKISRLFVFCFVLSDFSIGISAQLPTHTIPDSSSYISYPAFFERLEKQDSIRIFYQPEWFGNKKIHDAFDSLGAYEALSRVRKANKLSLLVIDQHSFVFVPFQSASYSSAGNNHEDILLVGNPNEYGKYTRATLSGKILDGKTGEPLSGATINIEKLKTATITDAKGNFTMNLPVGELLVKLSYIGYEGNSIKIKLLSDGNVDFELFEKSTKIKEVVITAERAEFNVTGTQMSLVHLSAKAIRELPVSMGETDIIKSISLLPGIQTAGDFGSGFSVRGGGSDQNLVLVEDVPLFSSSHLFGLNSAINPDQVSGVTLLKAGIPARYGERAASVMDIRLGKDNSDKLRVKGGIGLLDSKLSIQIPMFKNKASLLLGARSSYSNWLLHKMPNLDLMNSSAGFYDLNALYSINFNPNNKITLFGYFSDDKFAFDKITHYEYTNLLGSFRWTHLFNSRFSSSLLTGYSQFAYDVRELDTLHLPDAYQIKLKTQYNNLKLNFAWLPNNRHSVDFGINGSLYRIMPGEELPFGSESEIKPIKVESEKGLEMAAYISDNFDILPKLNAELGLRYVDYFSLGPGSVFTFMPGAPMAVETILDTLHYKNNQIIHQYYRLEPRLAFRYSLDEQSSLKWSYNRINQFINLLSNNSVMSPADIWTLSSTNLKPLTCDQYAVGYFRNFARNAYEVSVESYYKTLRNVIEYKNGAQVLLNDHLATDLLNATGFGYGIELYAKKNAGDITGWISYTYSRSLLKTSGATGAEQINGNRYYPSNFDKPNNFVVNAIYHISRRWRFSGTFTYNTGRPVTLPELKYSFGGNQLIYYSDRNAYRLPDYNRLDLAITFDENLKLKRIWKGSWTFSVINVYGRKNAYSVYYAREDSRNFQGSGNTGLYKVYIIGIPLPTLTYNFTF